MLMPSKLSMIFQIYCLPVTTNLVLKVLAMVSKVFKSSLNFWVEALDASDFVLDMIRRGYTLPCAQYSSQCFLSTFPRFTFQRYCIEGKLTKLNQVTNRRQLIVSKLFWSTSDTREVTAIHKPTNQGASRSYLAGVKSITTFIQKSTTLLIFARETRVSAT